MLHRQLGPKDVKLQSFGPALAAPEGLAAQCVFVPWGKEG